MSFLLSYTCACQKHWVTSSAQMEPARCGECGNYPVFPDSEEVVGEAGHSVGEMGDVDECIVRDADKSVCDSQRDERNEADENSECDDDADAGVDGDGALR